VVVGAVVVVVALTPDDDPDEVVGVLDVVVV